MILSKEAARVTHQSGTCIDRMALKKNEISEINVIQECFRVHYHLSLSSRLKSVAKTVRVFNKKSAFL